MPTPHRSQTMLACAAAATLLALGRPTPSRAEPREARQPSRATALERALTGGLVLLRAPGGSMIRVATSRFVLGSSLEDVLEAMADCATEPLGTRCTERSFSNELPMSIAETASFWLDRNEVTVAAYERCVAAGACPPRALVGGERRLGQPELPATELSAHEAEAYCRFRSARLPSESELERAARGTSGRRYPWGQLYNSHLANHGRFGLDRLDASDGFEELAPVGSFVAGRTPDGFLDLAGNAAEWTRDPYTERHGLPPEPGATGVRVVKGGHFANGAAWLRGAARTAMDADERAPFVGFRCARAAASESAARSTP